VFGYSGFYAFGGTNPDENGIWNRVTVGFGPFAGLSSAHTIYPHFTNTMTFAFSTPVSAVGGFMNYEPPLELGHDTYPTIAIYDSSDNLIESAQLTFHTGGADNSGFFYAFQVESNKIKYFKLTDNFIAIKE
jgi:hypothetical protein